MLHRILKLAKSCSSGLDEETELTVINRTLSSVSTTIYDVSPWVDAEDEGIVDSCQLASCETSLMKFSYNKGGGVETITFHPLEELKKSSRKSSKSTWFNSKRSGSTSSKWNQQSVLSSNSLEPEDELDKSDDFLFKFLPVLKSESAEIINSSVFQDIQQAEWKKWLQSRPRCEIRAKLRKATSDESLLMRRRRLTKIKLDRKHSAETVLHGHGNYEALKKRAREKAFLYSDRLDPERNLSYIRTTIGSEDEVYVAAFIILSAGMKSFSTDISYLLTNLLKTFFDPWEEFAVVWVPNIPSIIKKLMNTGDVSPVFKNQPIQWVDYCAVLVLTQDAANYFRHRNLAFLRMIACLVQCDERHILVIKLNS